MYEKSFVSTKSIYCRISRWRWKHLCRLKPSIDYRYGFQVAPYIVFFQSRKELTKFRLVCSTIGLGYFRERNDGMVEYTIGRENAIRTFLDVIGPYLIMKKEQSELMLEILNQKAIVKNREDFSELMKTIDRFRELNYSKKRKRYTLTP